MITVPARRHQVLLLALPQKLGGPAQLHPGRGRRRRRNIHPHHQEDDEEEEHTGLACMIDGSLALFSVPPSAFYEALPSPTMARSSWARSLLEEEKSKAVSVEYLIPPPKEGKSRHPRYAVTCAAFGKDDVVYAVTKCGTLLGFRLAPPSSPIDHRRTAAAASLHTHSPAFRIKVPGGAAAWQIIVSRNGSVLINSADCALRLYDAEELKGAFDASLNPPTPPKIPTGLAGPIGKKKRAGEERISAAALAAATAFAAIKPKFVFQDLVSKAPWASCDFSGDGEYVVGGCNSYPQPGDNYQLFLWNTATGELIDQLTGPQVSLYSLSCHPTRPFIAVGTSDGLVDVWGPRMDWTSFAPDFQALQQNVTYEEQEDEFDVVVDGDGGDEAKKTDADANSDEDAIVDINMVSKVPAFDSDSEDESDIFYFDTKVMRMDFNKPETKKSDAD